MGDEGGFAPDLASDEEAIEYILECNQESAGYEPGKDFVLAMDAASSEWKSDQEGRICSAEMQETDSHLLSWSAHWENPCVRSTRSISIEDGLDEEDWEGWQHHDKSNWEIRYSW